MEDPVAVEVSRGGRIESRHRGAGAVVDADGSLVLAFGDVDRPIFPRSAVKAFQALPLIESGAADRLGLDAAAIALACASHSGEPEHVAGARAMLGRAGAQVDALACGTHWPLGEKAARALARSGASPTPLHNNCSGKHAGFLCLAASEGFDFADYIAPHHPLQREVKAAIEAMIGETLDDSRRATDGCSIPTYSASLRALARGFARFATGQGLSPGRAAAAKRIRAAVAARPFLVAGTGRFDTDFMSRFGARVFTKTGAEGVFCTGLPEEGLGIAVKADDGGTRAAEAMISALINRFAHFDDTERAAAESFVRPTLRNWLGLEVGALRPAGFLTCASNV